MRAIAHTSNQVDRQPRRGRRIAIGVAGATMLGALALGSPTAVAQDETEPGKGNAYAQGYKIDPQNGQLSFGITYGMALAGHQNIQAIGEARSLDLGVIGVTLAAEGCDGGDPTLPKEDQPQPLVSRTDAKGGPKQDDENGVQRAVDSNKTPMATATAVTAGTPAEIPFSIGGSDSTSTSGVIDGRRTARAVTDVADFVIPEVLEITGMRWVAEYQTEPTEEIITRFSIEGIRVADTDLLGELNNALGGQLPLLSFDEPVEEIDQINELLEPLGITIQLPKTFVESGIAFVQPMRIGISPANDTIGEVFSAIQPVREALTGALFEIDCGTQSLVTVADIVAGSVSGAGALNLELGGVTATSGDIDVFQFPGFGPLPAPAVPDLPSTPPPSFSPSAPAPTPNFGTPTTPAVTPTPAPPTTEVAAPPATDPISSSLPLGVRGGPMLGIGLGVLALLGALAEGDRRKMRKAQKAVPITMTSDGGAG